MKIQAFGLDKFIETLRLGKKRVGIEIDGHAVRMVRVDRDANGLLTILSYGQIDIDFMHTSALERQRVKLAVRQLAGNVERVALNIEHSSLRVRKMNLAKMPENDLLEAIRWNFREHIEGPIEKYVVGYVPLEGGSEDKIALLAYGVASEALDEYLGLFRSLGFKPSSIEPSASALLSSFYANGLLSKDHRDVCIAFGDTMTLFSVMKGSQVLFCRPLPGASSDSMLRLVMRNLNIEEGEAKRIIKLWIDQSEKPQTTDENLIYQIKTSAGHFYSQLMIEIQRSIDAFCIMYGVEHVDSIHLCGSGVFYPGLVEHMRTTIGVATEVFNPFAKLMDEKRQTNDVKKVAPLYAIAVGLAIP